MCDGTKVNEDFQVMGSTDWFKDAPAIEMWQRGSSRCVHAHHGVDNDETKKVEKCGKYGHNVDMTSKNRQQSDEKYRHITDKLDQIL